MNSRKFTKKLAQKNQKEGFLIDYSSNEEQSGIICITKDLKITKVTMIIESKKNNFKNKYKKQTRRNLSLLQKNLLEDFLEEKFRSTKNKFYEDKSFSDEESDDEYSPSPELSPKNSKYEENKFDFDQFTGCNLSKQYKLDEINAVYNSQTKENSIMKEINQIVQNIYYDVSADMIEFSNLSGYQRYVVKSAMKDSEFIILACKCLIVCLTEFIKENFKKFDRFKSLREKFDILVKSNPCVFRPSDSEMTSNPDANWSNNRTKYKNKLNLIPLLQKLNKSNSEPSQNPSLFDLLDRFFKKNTSEKENILDTLEKFLYGLIKTVEKLEEIFKFLFESLKKEKRIDFNLKNILINELWNYLIQDELIFLLLKFSKTNENYKFITAKQKEYLELIENGVKYTNKEYIDLKNFFSINTENPGENEQIRFEFLSQSEIGKNSLYDDNNVTSSEKDEKKDSTFDNGSQHEILSENTKMDPNNQALANISKISDNSMSTKDSESTAKQALSDKNTTLIVVAEKVNQGLSVKISSSANINNENLSKKSNLEAKEICDKDANNDDNRNLTAKIIKITSYEEDAKKAESLTDKLEEYITRRNISVNENSISFEINFEKWCQKTFNKNLEEYIIGAEKEKDREKELLKNGNIDQLYDYINANDAKSSEKKKNKRKKKNKNKASKDVNNDANNSNDIDKNVKERAKCKDHKENNCFNNYSNKKPFNSNDKDDFSKIFDAEVELFKENIIMDNKKASDTVKIKPIFSTNWLQTLN